MNGGTGTPTMLSEECTFKLIEADLPVLAPWQRRQCGERVLWRTSSSKRTWTQSMNQRPTRLQRRERLCTAPADAAATATTAATAATAARAGCKSRKTKK